MRRIRRNKRVLGLEVSRALEVFSRVGFLTCGAFSTGAHITTVAGSPSGGSVGDSGPPGARRGPWDRCWAAARGSETGLSTLEAVRGPRRRPRERWAPGLQGAMGPREWGVGREEAPGTPGTGWGPARGKQKRGRGGHLGRAMFVPRNDKETREIFQRRKQRKTIKQTALTKENQEKLENRMISAKSLRFLRHRLIPRKSTYSYDFVIFLRFRIIPAISYYFVVFS